jgi:hypothetical protein
MPHNHTSESWISVDSDLPREVGQWYLISCKSEGDDNPIVTMAFFDEGVGVERPHWLCHNDKKSGSEWEHVTHWMPLPSPKGSN